MSKILVINGHPDPAETTLCDALAKAYIDGAREAGHEVTVADLGNLDFPLLRNAKQWQAGKAVTPEVLRPFQDAARKADHFAIIYPLWLGTMPALLKGFLELTFAPGVAFEYGEGWPKSLLKGKSARIVVTMGMPSWAYRWVFFAHSLKSLERNILGFVGIKPIRTRLFGSVEAVTDEKRKGWIEQMRQMGRRAI